MLDHRGLALGNLLVVFEVDELLEGAQILIQLSLDVGLRSREAKLVGIVKLCHAEIVLNFVDCLLNQSAALLAHRSEEGEL